MIKVDKEEWDSGLNIISNPKIVLDLDLLLTCDKIQEKFKGKEFSILVRGEYTDYGFYVSDDYVIPKQKVSMSAVTYDIDDPLDNYQQLGYNVVIHSHHTMGTFFSKTDEEYINCHFPCSVLYTSDGFTLGTMSFHKGEAVYLIETKDVEVVSNNELEVEGLDNIEVETYVYYPKKTKTLNKKGTYVENLKSDDVPTGIKVDGADCPTCSFKESAKFCLKCYNESDTVKGAVELFANEEEGWQDDKFDYNKCVNCRSKDSTYCEYCQSY